MSTPSISTSSFHQMNHVAQNTGKLDTKLANQSFPKVIMNVNPPSSNSIIHRINKSTLSDTNSKSSAIIKNDFMPSAYTDLLHHTQEAIRQRTIKKIAVEQQIAKEPENLDLKLRLAQIGLFLNDKKLATEKLQEIAKINPTHAYVYFGKYSIKLYEGLPFEKQAIKEAILNLRKALAIQPDLAFVKNALDFTIQHASSKLDKAFIEECLKEDPFKGINIDSDKVSSEYMHQYVSHITPLLWNLENYIMNEGQTFVGSSDMLSQLIHEEFKGKKNKIFLEKMTPEIAKVLTKIILDFDHPHALIIGLFSKEDTDTFFEVFDKTKCDGKILQERITTKNPHVPAFYELASDVRDPIRPIGASKSAFQPVRPAKPKIIPTKTTPILDRILGTTERPLISQSFYEGLENKTLLIYFDAAGQKRQATIFNVMADELFIEI